jgi:Ca2+-binding RTX toxin-like protein
VRSAAVVVAALATTVATADRAVAAGKPAVKTKITASLSNGVFIVSGSEGRDDFSLRLRSNDPTILEVVDHMTGAVLAFDRSDFDTIRVFGNGGDDQISIDESGGVFTDTVATTIDGGAGDDVLTGGTGSERFFGGPGNDLIRGGRGEDLAFMGDGDDTFVWNPGDGNDFIDGEAGNDEMLFNGANIAERIVISPNGSRVRFTRDVANITMDLQGVENIHFNALGGADTVTVNDLGGTDVTDVTTDLSAVPGTGTGDAATDNVIVQGTAGDDSFGITGANGRADVTGPSESVHVLGGEPANDTLTVDGLAGNDAFTADPAAGTSIHTVVDGGADNDTVTTNGTRDADNIDIAADGTLVDVVDVGGPFYSANAENLRVNGLAGDDVITAGNGLATLTRLTIDGGSGADRITGGDGADVLIGGKGRDIVDGGRGNDTAFLGDGKDTFVWNPGDGSDTVEGENGNDTFVFNGANIAEKVIVQANGPRVLFTRDVATITMDLGGVENIDFNALGGADTVTVDDLTGTAVKNVALDLANPTGSGTGDGAADDVIVRGTNGDDRVHVTSDAGIVKVRGLVPTVTVAGGEAANDRLDVDTLLGTDVLRSKLVAGDIPLFFNGLPA